MSDIQLLADLAVAVRTAASLQDIRALLVQAVRQAVGEGVVGLAARDLPDGALPLLGALHQQVESALGRKLAAAPSAAVREALAAGGLTALPDGVAALVEDPEAQALLRSRGVDAVLVLGSGPLALGVAPRGEVPRELVEALARVAVAALDAFAGDEVLRESEQRFRFLMANTTDSLVILDRDGSQRYVSPAAERITGFPVSELQGRSLPEIIHADDLPAVVAAWNEVLAHPEKPCRVQYRHRHKTREWVYSEASAQAFFDEPTIRGVVATVRDVTERIRVEEELRQSESRFRALAEHLPGVVYLCRNDAHYSVLYVSPEIERLTGFPLADFLEGRTGLFDIIHPDEAPGVVSAVEKALAQERAYNLSYRVRRRDGTWRWVEERGVGVQGREGALLQGFMADITERKEAEAERERLTAQLNQAQKMESIGRLAGGVAHDFNNMLGAILGNTELAMEQVPPTSGVAADLQEIRKAAERSADLTRQLLAFARKQTISPKVFDLNEAVGGSLRMLRRLIGEDVDLRFQAGEGVGQVRMDPTQLDQILANLCVNARDAIVDTGRITIETCLVHLDDEQSAGLPGSLPGDYVRLTVGDDGTGMDEETKRHLFEPFFTTKALGQGTGLGLAMVFGIVSQNEGFITVESELGRGTSLRIHLPRATRAMSGASAGESASQVGHETILLVEDEPAILQVGRRMLERLGYTVIPAASPSEALRLAQQHAGELHLLMTDVVMPDMNGRDLAKLLLSLYPGLKRLFMSGYTADVIAHHGVLDQGVHFIQKPFSMKDLGERVRKALEA